MGGRVPPSHPHCASNVASAFTPGEPATQGMARHSHSFSRISKLTAAPQTPPFHSPSICLPLSLHKASNLSAQNTKRSPSLLASLFQRHPLPCPNILTPCFFPRPSSSSVCRLVGASCTQPILPFSLTGPRPCVNGDHNCTRGDSRSGHPVAVPRVAMGALHAAGWGSLGRGEGDPWGLGNGGKGDPRGLRRRRSWQHLWRLQGVQGQERSPVGALEHLCPC